jgi:hypothetical protein
MGHDDLVISRWKTSRQGSWRRVQEIAENGRSELDQRIKVLKVRNERVGAWVSANDRKISRDNKQERLRRLTMQIFDLMELEAQGYEKRQVNVFYQNDLFKARIIVLESGGRIPECRMDSHVMFYVVEGEVQLFCDGKRTVLKEKQVFITEPALLSMESASGARLMGVQIKARS